MVYNKYENVPKDIKSHYHNSPCLNKRKSNFRRAITSIMRETEQEWSIWTICAPNINKSTRKRNIIIDFIRNHLNLN